MDEEAVKGAYRAAAATIRVQEERVQRVIMLEEQVDRLRKQYERSEFRILGEMDIPMSDKGEEDGKD
ncbi:hypothetical protein LCGC14_2854670 [marine sediment metagenome]|uniref:Uncharacterized protein n=1 Tax=marine sediment metagenome TaxID=412755 RepID=A0A0F8Y7A4_9ZZZZ